MVVVTRRLRAVVAPTERTEYADFPEDRVLDSSYGVAGRPLEDGEEEQKIFQEMSADPSITYFKPYSKPMTTSKSFSLKKTRLNAMLVVFIWIFGLGAGILLGLIIYLVAISLPYYSSTVSPSPESGIFTKTISKTVATFDNLPSLPKSLTASTLNLSPYLPFSASTSK